MFTISAFADEIGPDPQQQIDVLKASGVRHIEFRSIHGTNVLALSDAQIADFKKLLDQNDFKLSAIGSPIGKIKIDDPFEPHLKSSSVRSICAASLAPRTFAYLATILRRTLTAIGANGAAK
jgi:sugar phosphate isomerase/epimerase